MKIVFRNITAIIALTCFLASTTGLNLVEHYCSFKEVSFVFFFDQNPTCEDHGCSSKTQEDACCTHEHTPECCKNLNKFLKLEVDYLTTQHDVKNINCPIFIVERPFNIENRCHTNCECHFLYDLSEDVGPLKQLLFKRTTELLL